MKKIVVDGYKNYTSTLRVEEGANGCPCLVGEQDWDYKLETDIYIGSHRELAKMWQLFRLYSDYFLMYDEPIFSNDAEYCIVVDSANQFGFCDQAVPRICRMDQFNWDYYMDVTPYMSAYGDLLLAENYYKDRLADWEKGVKQ